MTITLDVLGVTAWGRKLISLQKKTKKKKNLTFLDFDFPKGQVDHGKQIPAHLGAVTMFMGTSSVPVASRIRFSPQTKTHN